MWDKIETFYYVVKAGSFTKAESVLHKSQSALSRTVITLEEQLGYRLLKRKHKGLELTDKGTEVFQTAQRMIWEIEGMKSTLYEEKGVAGKIRIATTYTFLEETLFPHLVAFNKLYPDVRFEIVANNEDLDLARQEVDIAIHGVPDTKHKETNRYTYLHLVTLHRQLYASQNYLDTYGTPKTLEDLDNHRLITFGHNNTNRYSNVYWILTAGHQENQRPRTPVLEVNSTPCIVQAAQAGLGIITGFPIFKSIRESNLVPIQSDIDPSSLPCYFIYAKRLEKVEKISTLRSFLRDVYHNM